MNKLVIDNPLQQDTKDTFLSLKEDTFLSIASASEIYLSIEKNICLDIECSASLILHVISFNQEFNCCVHLSEKANLEAYFNTMTDTNTTCKINVYHDGKHSQSMVSCHGISYQNGNLEFQVNGVVPKGISSCTCNQVSQIVTLGQAKGKIEPNLFIEEYDVIANHAAYIGPFKDELIFYLQTKGLSIDVIERLLLTYFFYQKSNHKTYQEKIQALMFKIFN